MNWGKTIFRSIAASICRDTNSASAFFDITAITKSGAFSCLDQFLCGLRATDLSRAFRDIVTCLNSGMHWGCIGRCIGDVVSEVSILIATSLDCAYFSSNRQTALRILDVVTPTCLLRSRPMINPILPGHVWLSLLGGSLSSSDGCLL